MQNPYKGGKTWEVPENVEITVTLFRDPKEEEFEDKEWTFQIEDVSVSICFFVMIANFGKKNFERVSVGWCTTENRMTHNCSTDTYLAFYNDH